MATKTLRDFTPSDNTASSSAHPVVRASMTVTELSGASGVSARNIRRYVELGLLHGAVGKTRVARYGPSHLARLEEIKAQLADGARLDEIAHRKQRGESQASALSPVISVVPGLDLVLVVMNRNQHPVPEEWVERLVRRLTVIARRMSAQDNIVS